MNVLCYYAGTMESLKSYANLATSVDGMDEDPATKTSCNKDNWQKGHATKVDKGNMVLCGRWWSHNMWQPLYK